MPQNLPLFTVSQIFRTARPVKKDRFSMPVPSLGVRPVPPAVWRKKGPSPQMPLLFPQNEQSWKGRISRTGRKAAAMGVESGTACSPCFPFSPLSFLSRKGPGPVRGRAARGQKADEQHKSGRNIAFRPVLCYINLVLFNMISCILFAILRKEGRNVAKCVITGKKTSFGNTRSHAMNASRRTWKANLHKVRILVNGKPKRVYVSARALKSGKVKRV